MPKYTRFVTTTRKAHGQGLTVIILAASMGYRMKSYGPQSLIPTSEGPTLIESQLANINLILPKAEVILTVGFEADKIIKRRPENVRIIENQYYDITNTIEDIRLALNNTFNDEVLIFNGNTQFNNETIKGLTTLHSSAITIVKENPNEEIGATIVDDKITILAHDISPKWCNMAYFAGKEFKMLKSIVNDRDKNRLYLFEVINMILEKNGIFKPYINDQAKVTQIQSAKDIK